MRAARLSKRTYPSDEYLTRFESVGALFNSPDIPENQRFSTVWAGGTLDEAREYARRGDLSSVAEVERRTAAILEPLAELQAVEISTWERGPVGAFPSVPDYLAGSPDNMWQRQPTNDERPEIRLFLAMGGTQEIAADNMRNFGASVAALLLALSQRATVAASVYFCGYRINGGIFPLSSPLNMSEVCAVFCQPCVYRQGAVGILSVRNQGGRVPVAIWEKTRTETRRVMGKYGAAENSIIFSLGDVRFLSTATPQQAAEYLNKLIREALTAERTQGNL